MTSDDAADVHADTAIRTLIAQYSIAIDGRRMDEVVGLFTDDGSLEVGDELPRIGRQAIADFFASRPKSIYVRHHVTTISIELLTPSTARATAYFMLLNEAGLHHWGRLLDEFRRGDDGWRFTRRAIETEGRSS